MADVIQLLPDAIANQIAAGEVIQRPASVVKELMENAIDAGSTKVQLVIKDAGKTLIQVVDNGCGMSETDARLAFERHATSKIRQANDLFAIRTMGFRGEALASIAAVAQVELKTRRHKEELGVRILMEASELKKQEPCQANPGTSFSVKNLFFNVPARRRFLKSDSVEMKHILDEFQRIAIANPDVFFTLHHNDTEVYHLPAGNLRQRLTGIFGNHVNKKLVPLQLDETEDIQFSGYVGKPEFARKTRGEQLFFVNDRFIKSGYLHHAVMSAYEELLPKDTFPLYIIFIHTDPEHLDINVHPTKQEIKFDNERMVYNYLRVAVRHALGRHNITPTLDFDQEVAFNPGFYGDRDQGKPAGDRSDTRDGAGEGGAFIPTDSQRHAGNLKHWQDIYAGLGEDPEPAFSGQEPSEKTVTLESNWSDEAPLDDAAGSFSQLQKVPYQLHGVFIVSQIKSGFLLIDQQAAHERILYERYLELLQTERANSQRQLFATTVELSPADADLLRSLLPSFRVLGMDIEEFGRETFVMNGVPAELAGKVNEQKLLETLLEQYKTGLDLQLDIQENLARSMARSAAVKRGKLLTEAEMQQLIDELFACSLPYMSPSGKNCFLTFDLDELERKFNG